MGSLLRLPLLAVQGSLRGWAPFRFHEQGELREGDLRLVLRETIPPEGVPWAAYAFVMRHASLPRTLGRISLRIGDGRDLLLYYGHIGYRVDPRHRGHRYAGRACRLLLGLARAHGLRELWITCDPDNVASRRTCEGLGATLAGIVPVPRGHPVWEDGSREKCRYRWPVPPAAA